MFKRKEKVKEIKEPNIIVEKQFTEREIENLKILIKLHLDDIGIYRLNKIAKQPEEVKYPYGRGTIPFAKTDKKKKVKGNYNPEDY